MGDMGAVIGLVEDMIQQGSEGSIDHDLVARLIKKLDSIIEWLSKFMEHNRPATWSNTEGDGDLDWVIQHNGKVLLDLVVRETSQVLICKQKLLFAQAEAEVCNYLSIYQ